LPRILPGARNDHPRPPPRSSFMLQGLPVVVEMHGTVQGEPRRPDRGGDARLDIDRVLPGVGGILARRGRPSQLPPSSLSLGSRRELHLAQRRYRPRHPPRRLPLRRGGTPCPASTRRRSARAEPSPLARAARKSPSVVRPGSERNPAYNRHPEDSRTCTVGKSAAEAAPWLSFDRAMVSWDMGKAPCSATLGGHQVWPWEDAVAVGACTGSAATVSLRYFRAGHARPRSD